MAIYTGVCDDSTSTAVSIATAFPLMFLLIVLVFGTFRGLRKYRENELEA